MNDFGFRFVDEEFIYDELRSLTAADLDDIARRFLREGAKKLSPLIRIKSTSPSSETLYPNKKLIKVIKLFKKDSSGRLEVGNHRPASLLNTVSKVLVRFLQMSKRHLIVSTMIFYVISRRLGR